MGDEGLDIADEDELWSGRRPEMGRFLSLKAEVIGNLLEDRVCEQATEEEYRRLVREPVRPPHKAAQHVFQGGGCFLKSSVFHGILFAPYYILDKKTLVLGLEDVLVQVATSPMAGFDRRVDIVKSGLVLGTVSEPDRLRIGLYEVPAVSVRISRVREREI